MANEEARMPLSDDEAHPGVDAIAAWLRGQAPGGRPVLHHLLGCAACAGTAVSLLAEADRAQGERNLERDRAVEAYRGLWARLDERLAADQEGVRREQAAAEGPVAELLALPPAERPARLRAEPRLGTWAVAERLLRLAAEAPAADPAGALALAELAAEAAGRLAPDRHSPGLLRELGAEAHLRLGEARRLAGRLDEAEAELRRADAAAGPDPWSARGEFCRALARLRQDQGRTDEALALFGRASDLLEDAGRTGEAIAARAEEGTLDLDLWRIEEAAAAFDTVAALCLGPGVADPVDLLDEAAGSLARQGRTAAGRQLIEQARQHVAPVLEPAAEEELAAVEKRWRARWGGAKP
jgi:hypothetical protein